MNNLNLLFGSMEYFLSDIKDNRIKYTYKLHRGHSIQNKVLMYSPKLGELLLNNWRKEIDNTDVFIMFDSQYHREVAEYIKMKNPKSKIYFYFWNSITKKNQHFLFERTIDQFWTFDPSDAEKYYINFNPQFYSKNVIIPSLTETKDIFFVGRQKNREQLFDEITNKINLLSLDSEMHLIEDSKTMFTYKNYLTKVASSKSLLDIVNEGQVGLTLRCMESLFFKKKLVTNNQNIQDYDFYNPQNIFIIGKDPISELKDFINAPYQSISDEIVEKYDFEQWVKKFKGQN